jgi:hypothetical protein
MSLKLLSPSEINVFLPLIEAEKVSRRARKEDGFLTVYLSGRDISRTQYPGREHSYLKERENFLRRTIPQYVKAPTLRRFLALISWAFMPRIEAPLNGN